MRETLLIALFEARRAFRPKDLVGTVLVTAAMALVFGLVQGRGSDGEARSLAVLGPLPGAIEGFEFEAAEDEAAARERLGAKEIDGLLDLRAEGSPRLVVRKAAPAWRAELDAGLGLQRLGRTARELGLGPQDVARLVTPLASEVESLDAAAEQRILAALLVVLALVAAVLGSSALLFSGITGEKRRRVTETVVAIVPPQRWIDGKLLGLAVVSLQTLGHVAVGWVVFRLVSAPFGGTLDLVPEGLRLADTLPFLLVALPGFAFWFCLVAAFCATIDDPDTSARGSILLLPPVALAAPLLLLREPGSEALRLLSLLPPTAPTAMPMRWILSEVAAWEVVLCLVLLLGSVHLLRLGAGRIFAASMLLHGTEPSLAQMACAALGRQR